MAQPKYVLLDRDGVINHDSDAFIKSPDEWLPIDGSLEAIALLNKNDYQVIVITNQSGVGRGHYSDATLTDIHLKMSRMVNTAGGEISHIYYCPHLPDAGCLCRKPKPGMLLQFSKDANVALDDIYFIGDSLRDLEAGIAAGATPLLVKTGNGAATLASSPDLNVPTFENLYDAATYILSR
ncbi:MAG: D-glycero-beta-D-manno-heptose 1,7-bisphosphate 7-phosphatase [Candidatus Methanofishera endochildressiae]|jgi:D-glycero-D-manno-heptose 1,7-bisphosphate phosphatase|uniref:D,D-heptose 1,7-bisphosphate phosphatase n=1 Tax=Candidatus Methanofishera endochildressiae TaxID=2738884 RepID=A0A7Z0MNJ3_9GAMM|nr:D-glycero-beta-D-manno-heptose 1,7-bisphosphate 7-phosphatase [Candidatus Methanofishera endochildressiae]